MDYSTFVETRTHAYEYVKHLKGLAILKNHPAYERVGTDYEHPRYPESNFYYLTGVDDEDAWFVWDLDNNKAHIFFSLLPDSCKMWMKVEDYEEKLKKYTFDSYHKFEELPEFVSSILAKTPVPVHILEFANESEIREKCKLDDKVEVIKSELCYFINEARARKTPKEIKLMQIAADHSSNSFIETIKRVRPGMRESDVEAIWYYFSTKQSQQFSKLQAFLPISSFGTHSAILHHYAEDDIISKEEENCLLDAGTEYYYYSADITRTFPISGVFKGDYLYLYETVLLAQKGVLEMIKEGVNWADCHRKALEIVGERLIAKNIIHSPSSSSSPLTISEAIEKDLVSLFLPHGLGHMLGIDTHDVAGYYRGGPIRSTKPSFDKLRLNRVLERGMVVTVEPGCYFNPFVVNPFLEKHPELKEYIDIDQLEKVWYKVGGVRIEDDVVITETGYKMLTHVPKEPKEIEALMAEGKKLPPMP